MAPGSSVSSTSTIEISQEMTEIIRRIQETQNVMGVMVLNYEGFPVKSNLDNTTTVQYGHMVAELAEKAKSIVRDLDPTNSLTFFRLKSTTHEVLVAPEEHFIILVLQHNNGEK